MAHVNLMTDTAIANLPPDGLRAILRSILGSNPEINPVFEHRVKTYLDRKTISDLGTNTPAGFQNSIALSRVMLGCGMWARSLHLTKQVLHKAAQLSDIDRNGIDETLRSLDGDLIQAVTAIEKTQSNQELSTGEVQTIENLYDSLISYRTSQGENEPHCNFDRSVRAVASVLGRSTDRHAPEDSSTGWLYNAGQDAAQGIETFELSGQKLPRLFTGLWQLSSPSWGVASRTQIFDQFRSYVQSGLTAYDMADHYGDAEVLYGEFKSQLGGGRKLFASTKLCIFQPVKVTTQCVRAKVDERCRRLNTDKVDLLQFHWQFYDDPQYIDALRLLEADTRISLLGLCNFDTQRMEEIIAAGVRVVSNQIQFSLIDSRPTVKMGAICESHDIKLLTYGTLCGGFLSEKWLGKPEPELYSSGITPSQRKYFEMIAIWGGWQLFQELLQTLKTVATKHDVSMSNVATRWVLDFPYVGAVIVGARMGVSEHVEDNLKVYGWQLDDEDNEAIDQILRKSRRYEVSNQLGDCGVEYRL